MRRLRTPTPLLTLLALAGMAFGQGAEPVDSSASEPGAPASQPAEAPQPTQPTQPTEASAPEASSPDAAAEVDPLTEPAPDESAAMEGADDSGPIVVGVPRETWSGFKLIRWDGGLSYRYQKRVDELDVVGQPKQRTEESRNRYLLDLSGEAIIGHRNLFDLTGSVQLGLEEVSTQDSLGLVDDEEDFLSLYDINALILGASKMPTDVYMRREQDQLDRAFAGTIDETITEYGIDSRLQTENSATTFRLFQREQELQGGFDSIDSAVTQQTFSVQSGIRLTPMSKLDAGYVFDHINEDQGSYQDDYNRHDATVVHTQGFGGETAPHELRSSLRLFSQDGLQEQTRFRWDELLTLRHTERFDTRYTALFEQTDVQDQTQRQYRAEAQARYRTFESLVTTVSAGGQRLEIDSDFTSDELFTQLQFDYTKKVPLGRIDAAVGGAFNAQSNSDRGSTISVINEARSLNDAFPTIIARRNIIASTVVIRAVGGFPTYIEGLDYTLTVLPDRMEIRTVIGSAISNGQTVWISYDVGPEPGSDIDTSSLNFSFRYSVTEGTFDGLALYARYNKIYQDLRSGDPTLITLEDLDDVLVGIEYENSGFTALYEFNDHESTFDPYSLHRVELTYAKRIGLASQISADVMRESIDFRSTNEELIFDRASITGTWRLSQSTELTAKLQYRREDSSIDGVTEGFDEKLGLTWHYGRTRVTGAVKNSNVTTDTSDEMSQFFEFQIERRF